MKLVIQRCTTAQVAIDNAVVSRINHGLMILVGVAEGDTLDDVTYLAKKVAQLRIFDDEAGVMNLNIQQVGGSVLSVSQFTLLANTKKGNRPSYSRAASPDLGKTLYDAFNDDLQQRGIPLLTGEFGANMQVSLTNDGPVTIIIDSRQE